MTDLKKLEQELGEKEKIFDEKYISGKGDYLSEEAEKMRQDIWRLRSKITDLKEKQAKVTVEITDFSTITYSEIVITEIVKRDDEITKQAIKDYFRQKYSKENFRFNFLDEEIVDEIIKLGISEYLKRRNTLGGTLSGK